MSKTPTTAPIAPETIFSAGHYLAKAAQRPYITFFNKVIAPRFWLFGCLTGIILGSQLAYLISPLYGIYATLGALITCMAIALKSEAARMLAISTGIIPLSMLITLCLPQTDTFSQMIIFYDAILLLALTYRFMFTLDEPAEHSSLGWRGYLTSLPAVIVLGQLLGLLAYSVLKNHYAYDGASFGLVASCAVVFAIAEEMFFRGLIQQRASKVLHPGLAAGLSAALFACLSIGTGNVGALLVALTTGATLSTVYYKKPNLILTIVLNVTAKLLYLGLLATFTWSYF